MFVPMPAAENLEKMPVLAGFDARCSVDRSFDRH
jgi:hypothetical protein